MNRTRRTYRRANALALGLVLAVATLCARTAAAQMTISPATDPAADPAAQPAPETEAQYQTTIANAVHEFSLSNWAEARALFRRAHQLSPSARTWRGMGMAAFELKMYVDAQRELQAALADTQRPLTPEQRTQVASLFEQTKSYVGKYHVVLEPASAKVDVDGQDLVLDEGNVLLLGLGDHAVSARASGFQETKVTLKVEGGEDLPLELKLSATPPPQPMAAVPAPTQATAPTKAQDEGMSTATTAGFVLLGTAAVFGAGSAVFWFVGQGQYDKLDKGCGSTVAGCSNSEIADSGVETSDLLHEVGLGVAGAALVGSVVCFVIGANDGGDTETAALHVGPTSVNLRGSF